MPPFWYELCLAPWSFAPRAFIPSAEGDCDCCFNFADCFALSKMSYLAWSKSSTTSSAASESYEESCRSAALWCPLFGEKLRDGILLFWLFQSLLTFVLKLPVLKLAEPLVLLLLVLDCTVNDDSSSSVLYSRSEEGLDLLCEGEFLYSPASSSLIYPSFRPSPQKPILSNYNFY